MTQRISSVLIFALLLAPLCLTQIVFAQDGPRTIPVDSPAFVFSPGNWVGDAGRGGSVYRQTWNAGAYFRVSWATTSPKPTATLLLDTSTYGTAVNPPPNLAYSIDGVWTANVPCQSRIPLNGLTGAGNHRLTVYVQNSAQRDRWGSPTAAGPNVVRVQGLEVDAGSTHGTEMPRPKWVLEIGDSITEGIQANNGQDDNLADYSYFVGQALQTQGYEYAVSACGYSGWLARGDGSRDVPAYYFVSGSTQGQGGIYDDAQSRWNKIDGGGHSLLDSKGHLSAYGQTGQEPAMILINYGTNDALGGANASDEQASITQCLAALRRAAPQAQIFLLVPFGQFDADVLQASLNSYKAAHPADTRVALINLGKPVANALAANGYWSGLHPNLRAHAVLAAQILAAIEARLK